MAQIIAVGAALAGIGMLINQQEIQNQFEVDTHETRDRWHNPDDTLKDTHHSRYTEEVGRDELERSQANYKEFLKWWSTRGDNQALLEKDIYGVVPTTTTTKPAYSQHQDKVTALTHRSNLQGIVDEGTKAFNARRRHLPDPKFSVIGTNSESEPIVKTDLSKMIPKHLQHNNMTPFFGSHVPQNTRPGANDTILERFTGRAPLYDHKKETPRFFPVYKDPYAVLGQTRLPVTTNREMERYIPSQTSQNVLPFEQVRVAAGLNLKANDNGSNIGFHDPYRPLGRGIYQDVNKIRVNPKYTYQSDNTGRYFFVNKGELAAPVYSRRPWKNLSVTNFKNDTNGNPIKDNYREILPTGAEVDKGQVLDKNSIILKVQERNGCPLNLGPNHREVPNVQVYSQDDARRTIRETTENAIHSHINPNDEQRRHQTYFFDCAQETIRQQTEVNKHSHINPNDEQRRGQTYFFDCAKETIKQQTEDNIHSHINPQDEQRRGQTYFFDCAKETIRQQTEDNLHINNPIAVDAYRPHDTQQFNNAEINGLREAAIPMNRPPVPNNVDLCPQKENIGDYETFRRQQFCTYEFTKSHDTTAPTGTTKIHMGSETQVKPEYEKDVRQQADRINPVLTQAFRDNPYTQTLHAWNIPYNQAYPAFHTPSS